MIWLEIDANLVRPGWTPLLITVALGAVLVFLALSMRKQMRRINPDLPYEAELRRGSAPDAASPSSPVTEMEPPQSDQPVRLRRTPDQSD